MHVSDLMTESLVTASPDDLVDESILEMKMSRIRHLPVVDERFRLVGIVSDRDLLIALGRNTHKNVYIKDVMTKAAVSVSADHPAEDAVHALLQFKIGALPVVGEEGQLIGIVTESDFLRLAENTLRQGHEVEMSVSDCF